MEIIRINICCCLSNHVRCRFAFSPLRDIKNFSKISTLLSSIVHFMHKYLLFDFTSNNYIILVFFRNYQRNTNQEKHTDIEFVHIFYE